MVSNFHQQLQETFGEHRVRFSEPMSIHTAFRSGGSAEAFIEIDIVDDIIKACKIAQKNGSPVRVIGAGQNLIVPDKGIAGLVIKNNCRKFELLGMAGRVSQTKVDLSNVLIFSESGVILNQLVRFTVDQGLSGLEYQLGLPGTVGGAICMNSNYPKEEKHIGDAVYRANILLGDGAIQQVDNSYFRFAFNRSSLLENGSILLSVIFRLAPMDKKMLWEKATEAITYRNTTHPVEKNEGLTFRNTRIENPSDPLLKSQYTIEYLVGRAGISGKRVGNCALSPTNPRYILNMGNAKESDVLSLIQEFKDDISKNFGLRLLMDV